MIRSFRELVDSVKDANRRIAVAVAQDTEVLFALRKATDLSIAKPILVGDEKKIREISEEKNISLDGMKIIDEVDIVEASRKAVKLVHDNEADVLMKGLVDTSVFLKAVLDKEIGLKESDVLSHVALFDVKGFDRLIYVTDVAMCIAPDVLQKEAIINNAVKVSHALDNDNPVVACLCATEKVNPKMQATLDAEELVKRNKDGLIKGCIVLGPLALDNAISVEAAKHKGIEDEYAGRADILLVPYIEAGNILYKSLTYMAGAENGGIIVGASAPVILTSRADSNQSKFNSIALAIAVANK